MKKLLLLLVVLFGISSVCAVEYSGYDYEYYVKVSNISTNGTIQAIPIYLVKSYDNYDFDKDGDIDSADKEYAKTHGYIAFDPSKINKVNDVNFDDGEEQLPAENVYLNKSKHVYAKYIVYTDSSEFYVRLHAIYPHPLMTYTGNYSGVVPRHYDYWNDGSNIWVKLNLSAGESKTLYISTKNAYPGNGDAVFEFFDDFEGDSLDMNKWNTNANIYSIEKGIIKMWGNWNGNKYYINTKQKFMSPVVVIGKWRLGQTSGDGDMFIGFRTVSNGVFVKNGYDCYCDGGEKRIRTGSTTLALGSGLTDTNWHQFRIIFKSDEIRFWDDLLGELSVSGHGLNEFYLGIGADTDSSSRYGYIDYIAVRKYVEQEPTATIEQIDSNTWKVVITNPNNYDLVDFQCKIPLAISQEIGVCNIITPGKTMTLSTVTLNTNTFTISGANGAIVNQDYTLTFDREAGYIIDWGDGYTSTTATTTATHKYTTVGNYTILVTMYSIPWDIHRTKTVLVSSNVLNVTVNCYYEDGTRINDTSVTITYILGQNTTQNGTINITTLANTIITAKINDIVRQKRVDIGATSIDFYFPKTSDYVVQEIIKSYNPEDWIQIRLNDKVISENKGELNTYLTLGTVYQIYVNGQYYQDIIVDNIPDTIIVKTSPVHAKILITDKPDCYEIYAISPTPKFYTVKVLIDNVEYKNFTIVAGTEGNIKKIFKSELDTYFASEDTTSYHTIAIFVYDGNKLVTWNKFLYAHYVPPPRTQTMAWMVLLALTILLGLTMIVAREFMWATMILGSAAVYVLSMMKIFAVDFNLTTLSGLLFGLGVVLYIITNLKK